MDATHGVLATDLRLGDRVTFATRTLTDRGHGRMPGDASRTVLLTGSVEAIGVRAIEVSVSAGRLWVALDSVRSVNTPRNDD